MAPAHDPEAWIASVRPPPPPGSPYSLPVPGSQKEGRSATYRHWRWVNKPLPISIHPQILTAHDSFEYSVKKRPTARCLGTRPYDPVTKEFGKYEWINYGEVALRRKNFGAGIVELHKKAGVSGEKYPVGLWCQNRAEWQIAGKLENNIERAELTGDRFGMYVSITFHCVPLRYSWTRDYGIYHQPCPNELRCSQPTAYSNPA